MLATDFRPVHYRWWERVLFCFFKQRLKKIRGSVAFGKEEENQAQQTCLEMIRHGGEQQRWCWRVCVTSAAASL